MLVCILGRLCFDSAGAKCMKVID